MLRVLQGPGLETARPDLFFARHSFGDYESVSSEFRFGSFLLRTRPGESQPRHGKRLIKIVLSGSFRNTENFICASK